MFETYESRLKTVKDCNNKPNNINVNAFLFNCHRPKQDYSLYKPLQNIGDKSCLEEWLYTTEKIIKTLQYLLSSPLFRFWSHVIHDEGFGVFVTSYLSNADRPHDAYKQNENHVDSKSSNTIKIKKESLNHLYFCLLIRMSTRKENNEFFIPEKLFGDILYENYIFDLPKILDICSIYHHDNPEMVKKIIKNIFLHQPKYLDDVGVLAQTLPQMFDTVIEKFTLITIPSKVPDLTAEDGMFSSLRDTSFEDLIFYVTDTSFSLRTFLDAYPPAAKVIYIDSMLNKVANFYDTICALVLPQLKGKNLEAVCGSMFSQCRINWLHVCHFILQESTLSGIEDVTLKDNVVEKYMSNVTSLLEHKRFVADYFLLFPLDTDKRLLRSAGLLDDTMMSYVTDAVEEALQHYTSSRGFSDGSHVSSEASKDISTTFDNLTVEAPVASCSHQSQREVGGDELMCMITNIQDLLPAMGSHFLKLCLQHFNYDTEIVINSLLEDKLPPNLASCDKSLNLTEAQLASKEVEDGGLLAQRRNIYDNDEFDVFNNLQNVDTSKIHIGKKDKLIDLNDKKDLKDLKPLFDVYGNEFTEGSYYDVMQNSSKGAINELEYEDEYDDAFDAFEVAVGDADSADELTSRKCEVRPLNKPLQRVNNDEEEEEDNENDENQKKAKSLNFLEDPAVLRERAAQRRAQQHRNFGVQPIRDVKGVAKGQGQSDKVLKDRHFKEKNKSMRANHNRKNLAGRKNRIF